MQCVHNGGADSYELGGAKLDALLHMLEMSVVYMHRDMHRGRKFDDRIVDTAAALVHFGRHRAHSSCSRLTQRYAAYVIFTGDGLGRAHSVRPEPRASHVRAVYCINLPASVR